MVAGYHLIWTAYGWWLPTDPRGSSSHEVRVEKLKDLGELYYGRKRVQPASAEIRRYYTQAEDLLQHPLLTFSDEEISLLGDTFGEVIRTNGYTCYECAIMPEHVHLLIRRHRDKAEEMIENFQEASRDRLIQAGHRAPTHPVWSGPGWKVFLNTRGDFERVVRYIRNNPVMAGRPEQRWPFVKKYDGWLPGYRGG
jgi:REP element-mobilizing transposase RayT